MKKLDEQKIMSVLTRGVEDVIVREHLESALRSGKKLRVKFGIDPTSPDIHLGHTVVLRKLRQFQDLGHKIVLIIGDFTARIGDPSGRTETRKTLTVQEVKQNEKTYLKQASKIIDVKKTEVHHNSEWHEKKGLSALLMLAQTATVQQVLKRDDFEKRLGAGTDIALLELLYPLLQGYDSVAIRADVELGGTDQTFNMLMGRRVQRAFNMSEQDVLTVPIIEGLDGVKKMSKSIGNYVGLTEAPEIMFGKIMSIPDSLVPKYFTLLTFLDAPENFGPYESKMLLAETITALYHGEKKALEAREEFVRVFSKKQTPQEMPLLHHRGQLITLLDLVCSATEGSKSDARRLIDQRAVEINEVLKTDVTELLSLKGGEVLKIGKKRFWKII